MPDTNHPNSPGTRGAPARAGDRGVRLRQCERIDREESRADADVHRNLQNGLASSTGRAHSRCRQRTSGAASPRRGRPLLGTERKVLDTHSRGHRRLASPMRTAQQRVRRLSRGGAPRVQTCDSCNAVMAGASRADGRRDARAQLTADARWGARHQRTALSTVRWAAVSKIGQVAVLAARVRSVSLPRGCSRFWVVERGR